MRCEYLGVVRIWLLPKWRSVHPHQSCSVLTSCTETTVLMMANCWVDYSDVQLERSCAFFFLASKIFSYALQIYQFYTSISSWFLTLYSFYLWSIFGHYSCSHDLMVSLAICEPMRFGALPFALSNAVSHVTARVQMSNNIFLLLDVCFPLLKILIYVPKLLQFTNHSRVNTQNRSNKRKGVHIFFYFAYNCINTMAHRHGN